MKYKKDMTKEQLMELAVYENSKDCLYFGYSFSYLNYYNLSKEKAKKIWAKALKDLTKLK